MSPHRGGTRTFGFVAHRDMDQVGQSLIHIACIDADPPGLRSTQTKLEYVTHT